MEHFAFERGEPDWSERSSDRAIEQVADHAIFVIDRHGRAATWNLGVERVVGYSAAEWIGLPARELFTAEDRDAGEPDNELRQALETGRAGDDRWLLKRDGQRFFASGTVTRIDDEQGRPIGFAKVIRDFSGPRRVLDEREALLRSESLARSEAERQAAVLTAAIEAIPDGVYIADASGVVRCNQPALEILGVSTIDELNEPPERLVDLLRMRHAPTGLAVTVDELPFVRALKGETAVVETWLTKKSTGEEVLVRATAAPIRVNGQIVGAVAVNSDLTERMQLEQKQHQLNRVETELRERDEQLRAVFSGVRDYAIFTVDLEGNISSWHEGAALMKGYTAEQAIGMPFAQLFPEPLRRAGRPQYEMDVAARTGEYKGEGQRMRASGALFDAAVVLTALHGSNGRLLGYLKLTQDISERRRQEREREQMLRNAQAARAGAERASQAMSEFLANISHELRTPLGAIVGWAHMLERETPDPQILKQGLSAIARNARVQVRLIEDLLDMSRMDTEHLRLDKVMTIPAVVIAKAIDAVLPSAASKGIELRTVFDPRADSLLADPDRLQQIVWNLLTNAVKFTPAGGRITVTVARTDAGTDISVADNGQGIDPDFLPRVFDRFQQEDASTTRRHGGLGIGLAIAQQLAERHGGKLRAVSEGLGRGTTFTLSLPDGDAAAIPAGPDPAGDAEHADRAAPLHGTSVLLIDDEADARDIAAYALRQAGAEVTTAASAEEGFDLLRRRRPDVVVCDIGMPTHDGYDFVRWVRSLAADAGGATPMAAFTAFARIEDRERAIAAGFHAHLSKPTEPDELVAAVVALARLVR